MDRRSFLIGLLGGLAAAPRHDRRSIRVSCIGGTTSPSACARAGISIR